MQHTLTDESDEGGGVELVVTSTTIVLVTEDGTESKPWPVERVDEMKAACAKPSAVLGLPLRQCLKSPSLLELVLALINLVLGLSLRHRESIYVEGTLVPF